MKPILYLIKYFLKQRGLNEAFTGGISSFVLFNMVYAYFQQESKNSEDYQESRNLGSLLLGFLKFYGCDFDYRSQGLSVRNGGIIYNKYDRNYPLNDGLSIENFLDPSIDIARSAYKFPRIKNLFEETLITLYKLKTDNPSILNNMITVTTELKNIHIINN